jgi:hypothetical protein
LNSESFYLKKPQFHGYQLLSDSSKNAKRLKQHKHCFSSNLLQPELFNDTAQVNEFKLPATFNLFDLPDSGVFVFMDTNKILAF